MCKVFDDIIAQQQLFDNQSMCFYLFRASIVNFETTTCCKLRYTQSSDAKMVWFLEVARSFVHKVQIELETSSRERKEKKKKIHSQRLISIRTQFVLQVQNLLMQILPAIPIRAIDRDLQVSQSTM